MEKYNSASKWEQNSWKEQQNGQIEKTYPLPCVMNKESTEKSPLTLKITMTSLNTSIHPLSNIIELGEEKEIILNDLTVTAIISDYIISHIFGGIIGYELYIPSLGILKYMSLSEFKQLCLN